MPSGLVSVFVYFAVSHVCWALGFRIVRLIALRAQPLSFKTQTCAVSTHYIISCRVPVVVQSLPVCESCWSAYQDACHVRPVFADLLWFCSASLSLCRCSRFRFLPSARYCSFVCLAPVFRSHPSTRIRPGFDLMLLSTWHLRQTSFFLRVCY